MGFFSKIKEGLTKTRKAMEDTLSNVFSGFSSLDDDFYDELEECLIWRIWASRPPVGRWSACAAG